MKCPIPFVTLAVDSFPPDYERRECLKEECAWWDKLEKECNLTLLTKQLDGIRTALFDMVNKLPHAE